MSKRNKGKRQRIPLKKKIDGKNYDIFFIFDNKREAERLMKANKRQGLIKEYRILKRKSETGKNTYRAYKR